MRYAWDLQDQYLRETGLDEGLKGSAVRALLKRLREWDRRNTDRVQYLIANSEYISRRIWNCYRRESTIIYPPVSVDDFSGGGRKEDFYLTVSRLVPYKKVDLIVTAFRDMPDKRLIVVGDGPDFQKVQSCAGPNVQMAGALGFHEMKSLLQRAKAFVFAAEEDFGISVVEAQAAGTPVIAYGKGGALETVRGLDSPQPTGLFFESQDPHSLQSAIRAFESAPQRFSAEACRANARRFDVPRFREAYAAFVNSRWAQFQNRSRKSPA